MGLANGTRSFNPTSRQCVCSIALTLATYGQALIPTTATPKLKKGVYLGETIGSVDPSQRYTSVVGKHYGYTYKKSQQPASRHRYIF